MPLTYQDQEHLKLLSIFHYVVAGLMACFACMGLIYVAMGIAMLSGGFDHGTQAPPEFVGVMVTAMGGVFLVLGWTLAICVFFAGRNIARHRRHTFCLVIAGLCCMWMPFGTILGVFTFVVLLRPQVKEAFTGIPAAQPMYPVYPMSPAQPIPPPQAPPAG